MARAGWLKRQAWFWPVKLLLKRIVGKELWLRRDISVETMGDDDWRYIANMLSETSIVYSLGVGDSVDFDLDIIRRFGSTVYAFDPTPYATQWVAAQALPKAFVFNPWAAAEQNGSLRLFRRANRQGKRSAVMWTADANAGDPEDFIDAPAYTITGIMEQLGHDQVDLLKMDVEGAEYGILDGLQQATHLPRQLLVEFHHRFPGIGKQRTVQSIAMLKGLGYKITSISETGREIGFLLSA